MNEYSKLRKSLIRTAKGLMQRGYDIEKYEQPKTIKELGHEPTQEDIENLKRQRETIYEKSTFIERDPETGDKKRVPYSERIKYERKEWARHKSTKVKDDKDDSPPINDEDVIIYNFRKILDLINFSSSAKSQELRTKNEEIVFTIASEFHKLLTDEYNKNKHALAVRLAYNQMDIDSIYTKTRYAYLLPDKGASLPEEFKSFITGNPTSIEEAKKFDDGYDDMPDEEEIEDYPW